MKAVLFLRADSTTTPLDLGVEGVCVEHLHIEKISAARAPFVWLRLMRFLGFGRGRVFFEAAAHSGVAKLVAFALRGRVSFLQPGRAPVTLSLAAFLWVAFKSIGRRPGPVCLVGGAGRESLERILADLRLRYPDTPVYALVTDEARELPADMVAPLTARNVITAVRQPPRFGTVIFASTGEGHFWLKLLAFSLPLGYREIYNENGDHAAAREIGPLLRHIWWRLCSVPERVTVLGAAPTERLAEIVAAQRTRHPRASFHGLLPKSAVSCSWLFDSVTVLEACCTGAGSALWSCAFGRRRSGYLVMPLTGEGQSWLKLLFWFLPLGRREFHNEHGNFCRARDLGALSGHLWRRAAAFFTRRPQRVTVLGSASGLYLKTIVADVRVRYPGAPIHALLLPQFVVPVAHLFDSYTVLRPTSAAFWREVLHLSVGRRRSGHFVIPATKEGYSYNLLKLTCIWLPFGLRIVYNENADAYLPRNARMLVRHTFWRLRHRILYQALTELHGRFLLLHLVHLVAYPVRLLMGAVLLASVRVRTLAAERRPVPATAATEVRTSAELVGANRGLAPGEPVISGDS